MIFSYPNERPAAMFAPQDVHGTRPPPPPYWLPPAQSPDFGNSPVGERRAPHQRSRRRSLALAAVAILTVGGGTVGGAIAGRASAPTAMSESAVALAPTSTSTGIAATAVTKTDVSTLISTVLPSVVSITDNMNGGSVAGTGFVISADGDIATNAHVVNQATNIQVTFTNGTTADAKIVGLDQTDDLAVIKIDKTGLTALPLGSSSDLKMGEPVVAIGNALALTGGPTSTEGIVSALNRTIDTQDGQHLTHLIQTDAAINPGNSGGPLLTLDGKVVGIDSAGSQSAQNIGFAIAIDTAKPIIDQLQQGKTVTKAYLGVSTTTVDATVSAQYGLKVDHGLFVADVSAGSAAASAGIKPGDVILSAGGQPTNTGDALGTAIAAAGSGGKLQLTLDRNGTTKSVEATLSSHAA
jgi:S1-C subfamily serine protease